MFFIPFLSSKYRENGQVQSNLDFFFFFFLPPSCCCCCCSQNVDELPFRPARATGQFARFHASVTRADAALTDRLATFTSPPILSSLRRLVCVCVCVLALTTLSGRAHTSLGININANRPAMSRSTRPLDVLGCFFVFLFFPSSRRFLISWPFVVGNRSFHFLSPSFQPFIRSCTRHNRVPLPAARWLPIDIVPLKRVFHISLFKDIFEQKEKN